MALLVARFLRNCNYTRISRLCRLSSSQAVEADLSSSTASASKQWQLMSAVCLERLPSITALMNSLETDTSAMFTQIEMESSKLSDHELRHLDDLKHKQKQEEYEETDADVVLQTAVEAEDLWEEELNAFKPASRTTAADAANDVRSLARKLDRKLILLVKQKLGAGEYWSMPMGVRAEGETMRNAAERILESTCGSELKAIFIGNAPCGFYRYKYPAPVRHRTGCVGAKVFFFKAQLRSGSVTESSVIADHAWLSSDELSKYTPSRYFKCIKQFLLDV